MSSIRIEGMTRLEAMTLEQEYPGAEIAFEEQRMSEPLHGELATVALVTVSIIGLKLLAAYLLKHRSGATIKHRIDIVESDGSRRVEELEVTIHDEKAPEASVVDALATLLKVDMSAAS